MRALEGLQPERVFHYFEEISRIPRGSYHEKAISDYLVEYAKEHGIIYYQDKLYNVVMQVPASEGREDEEPVILQGHMDMVCEVRPGADKDMEKEGLELYVEGDHIHAKDTTLGGDDGIAVAYMLAIADDESISHPPLEFIITVSEEVGMEGANGIDLSMLKGHKMINIDSEDEGVFTTSCAGGVSAHVRIPVERTRAASVSWHKISVNGLAGGHSGTEIDKGRANANKILGRVLYELLTEVNFCLSDVCGGKKDNAIPIQAEAVIGFVGEKPGADECAKKAEAVINKLNSVLKNEYNRSDGNIDVSIKAVDEQEVLAGKRMNYNSFSCSENEQSDSGDGIKILAEESKIRVITYLMNVPDGIIGMSMSVPGLVETSLNLGILELKEDHLFVQHAVRSSVTTRKEHVTDQLKSLAAILGGELECRGSYPAWEYKEDSEVRERMISLYEKMYGKAPVVEGIHAGLECGLLAAKIPDLDCVSMGPDIMDIHTYNERLSISSAKRVYEFLLEFLKG
ncbi:MAG: aminoacyl-histidine dipeptidase [Lachnospiraceae bacterium]|nr:aminoacyl-histidine dipeptidase [Lachnospiraceae bacterium]